MQGVQFLFLAIDCSGPECIFMQRIDSFTVDINSTVGTNSSEIEYIGNAGLARLNISFEVRCGDDFYGRDCLTNCPDFQSCAGCGLPGYTGEYCQYDIDYCEGVTCNNSGECVDEIDGFVCNCDSGFTGDLCQSNIDDCIDINCNDGECVDGVDGFTCDCNAGFTGEFCLTNIDDCEGVDCNNGECVDGIGTFRCVCDAGFMGERCEEVDHCLGVNCSETGRCVNSPVGFTCSCDSGYAGDLCQEKEKVGYSLEGGILLSNMDSLLYSYNT